MHMHMHIYIYGMRNLLYFTIYLNILQTNRSSNHQTPNNTQIKHATESNECLLLFAFRKYQMHVRRFTCVWVHDFICNVRSQPKINIYISLHHNLGSTNFHAIPETEAGTRTRTTAAKIESAFQLESIFRRLYVRRQAHVYQRPDVESIGWLFSQCAFDSPSYINRYVLISHVIFSFTNQNLTHK